MTALSTKLRRDVWRARGQAVAVAVVVACAVGVSVGSTPGGLAALSAAYFSSDLFRIPVVVERTTWLFACGTTFTAALLTSLLARRWLARLDLPRALAPGE